MKEFNLTKSQQQIYDVAEYSADTVSSLCGYVVFDNDIFPDSLVEAVNELYKRNDALRIRISRDSVTQIAEEYRYKEIAREEFTDMDSLRSFSSAFASNPLSLFGELSEFIVFTVGEKPGVLLKIHHIISDAWSVNLLVMQLVSVLEGRQFAAPSFLEYVSKESDYVNTKQFIRDELFFSNKLKDDRAYPLIRDRSSSFASSQDEYSIEDDLRASIDSYCKHHDITPTVFWLSCYSILLGKDMNCAEDFFIGVPILNRVTTDELNTVGMFVNNAPLSIHLDFEKTFLQNVTENIENSYFSTLRHQRYNYSQLLHDSGGSKKRIYDVIFSYLPKQSDNSTFKNINQVFCRSQVESLQIHVDDNTERIYYSYKDEVFSSLSIMYFHHAVTEIVKTALFDSCLPIKDYNIISKEELIEIDSINGKTVPLSENGIYDVFDKVCKEKKDNICIRTKSRNYLYHEFENIVRSIDACIRKKLSGTQNVIAIYCDRGIEMYASIYAILRGGNIFLPVSPEYPREYAEYILSNSDASLVITSQKYALEHFSAETLNVSNISACDHDEAYPVLHGEVAYILYTSGSTGNPKGAAIRNDSLLNRIIWMQKQYNLSEQDVLLQKTPYTFDVSLWEIFWWATAGASMAICEPFEHCIPDRLLADIHKYCVTHIHFVPSVFENFLDYAEQKTNSTSLLKSIKHIYFSGEALHAKTVSRLKNIFSGNVKVHNLYGPTECAIDVTYYDCIGDEDEIPIGMPIDNVSAYIINDNLERVPFGSVGQLALGGVCVGKEYVNDADRTKESFVKNPFGDGNLYLTGDAVYLREDKNIIFLGRLDNQVKLNGQRIELSAIESCICLHDKVKTAVVTTDTDGGQALLRAFYTGAYIEPQELREFVKAKLPIYMVPHFWHYTNELPLTSHGKIDKKALLSMPMETEEAGKLLGPPLTETEAVVAEILGNALNKQHINRFDDFFLCGGSSLDMATVLSNKYLSGLTVFEFMQDPSPYGIAKHLKRKHIREQDFFAAIVKPERITKVLLVFPFAGGDISSFSALINDIKYNYPDVMIITPKPSAFENSIQIAADEIIELSNKYDVIFYSHCAGIAGAAALLNVIEKTDENAVKEYISTAMIPPLPHKGKVKSIWRVFPDFIIGAVLMLAGMPKLPTNESKRKMISAFRKDTDFFADVLSGMTNCTVKCPTRVLISKNDFFTRKAKNAKDNWNYYFSNVLEIKIASYNNHYFQSTDAHDISQFIFKQN